MLVALTNVPKASFCLDNKHRKFSECFNKDLPKATLIPSTDVETTKLFFRVICEAQCRSLQIVNSPSRKKNHFVSTSKPVDCGRLERSSFDRR